MKEVINLVMPGAGPATESLIINELNTDFPLFWDRGNPLKWSCPTPGCTGRPHAALMLHCLRHSHIRRTVFLEREDAA
jgi:hypothetical protein